MRAVGLGHQVQRRFQDGDQSAFRADQGAGDVEAVLRQQSVEVVAGDAARQLRKALRISSAYLSRNALSLGVNLAAAAACADDGLQSRSGDVSPTRMRRPS